MSLDDLLPITEALQLEKPKFNKIVKEFMKHSSYCGSLWVPEKMSEWCSYLQCDGTTCKNEEAIQALEKPKITTIVPFHCT